MPEDPCHLLRGDFIKQAARDEKSVFVCSSLMAKQTCFNDMEIILSHTLEANVREQIMERISHKYFQWALF